MLVEKIEKGAKNIVFIYTTCRDREEARAIGLAAIEEKLAVCADFWVINSLYPWRGVLEEVEQYMLMITTEEALSAKLISFVEGVHSYTTPMITRLDTSLMNPTYTFWVEDMLQRKERYLSEEEARIRDENENDEGYRVEKLK